MITPALVYVASSKYLFRVCHETYPESGALVLSTNANVIAGPAVVYEVVRSELYSAPYNRSDTSIHDILARHAESIFDAQPGMSAAMHADGIDGLIVELFGKTFLHTSMKRKSFITRQAGLPALRVEQGGNKA